MKYYNDILQYFDESVRGSPSQVALIHPGAERDQTLTYQQLDARANRLAQFLMRHEKFSYGSIVAVYTHRSLDTVVAMLAVLKAGAAFVPIDPMYPDDRIAHMLEQCDVSLVLTQSELKSRLAAERYTLLVLDDELQAVLEGLVRDVPWEYPKIRPEDRAYVIFTSGSTGLPKACQISQGAAAAFLASMLRRPGLKASHRVLANASISFDMMVYEIFFPFAAGATVVMTSRDVATDGARLVQVLDAYAITGMMATPATWRLILDAGWQGRKGFHLVSAGEALSQELAALLLNLSDEVWNMYGPTETTVITTVERVESAEQPISLGWPTQGVTLYVVNDKGQLQPPGAEGELWIGGPQVGMGYLKNPELTQQKFVPNSFDPASLDRLLYRTGDLVRQAADGRYEYLGRIDHQVKIRGYRIELGEIEAQIMASAAVRQAMCLVREDIAGDKRLIAYVQLAAHAANLDVLALKRNLARTLPAYMIPMHVVVLEFFPLTSNGKVDRKALPVPLTLRRHLSEPLLAPRNPLEESLVRIFADLLQYDTLSIHDHLFDMGLNSLAAVRAAKLLADADIALTAGDIFQNPTIASLAEAFNKSLSNDVIEETLVNQNTPVDRDIAIIGMAARLPGAATARAYWENLVNERESIEWFAREELSAWVPASERDDPNYVAARGLIGDVSLFDADFFGITPSEAAMIDPQQRLFLEECWHALEDSGYVPEKYAGRIGVYAGSHRNTYFLEMLKRSPEAIAKFGDFAAMIAAEKDFLATRVAHRLNLTGPALSIQTACSTSLVAVATAVAALRRGDCEMALAGGVTVAVPQKVGHLFQEGNILSRDGHCKPFADDASGTIFSDGVGVVVLKRRSLAEKDGDHIYAIIKGVAVNNDGSNKASFSAPSIDGQLACLKAAQQDAGVSAKDITYIEAHGTATPIGDPMETQAIKRAIAHPDRRVPCRIGSVKGNMGHTVAAAGVAGLMKTAFSLYHRELAPSLHAQLTNPACGFDAMLKVQSQREAWNSEEAPRVAGVSSFGVGGTNAHAVLSEAERQQPIAHEIPKKLLLISSAKGPEALRDYLDCLKTDLDPHASGSELVRMAWTLMAGRREHRERAYTVINTHEPWSEQIQSMKWTHLETRPSNPSKDWVWLFPGQGAQYPGMAREVYAAEPEFRQWFDRAHERLLSRYGIDLHKLVLRADNTNGAQAELRSTRITQVAIFVVSYALARFWLSLGLKPVALVGHSVGEFVAAALSGVMSFESALDLVVARGALLDELPRGSMLAVRAGAEEISLQLPASCSIAARNSRQLTVIAGPSDQVLALKAQLESRNIQVRLLETSHAFHSSMMDAAVAPLTALVAQHALSAPGIPIYSSVTGLPLTAEQAKDPSYWGHHVRATVDFAAAISLLGKTHKNFLEIGPRAGLSTLVRQTLEQAVALASLSVSGEPSLDYEALLKTLGQLWQRGLLLNWDGLGLARKAQRASLPGYKFQGKRYWKLPQEDSQALLIKENITHEDGKHKMENAGQLSALKEELMMMFEDLSGMNVRDYAQDVSFLEMGMDSLALTQIAVAVEKKYKTRIGFRDLLERLVSIDELAVHLAQTSELVKTVPATPAAAVPLAPKEPVVQPEQRQTDKLDVAPTPALATQPQISALGSPVLPLTVIPDSNSQGLVGLFAQQLHIIQSQMSILSGSTASQASLPMSTQPQASPVPAITTSRADAAISQEPVASRDVKAEEMTAKPFGAIARITKQAGGMTPSQKELFDRLCERYTTKTRASKRHTEEYRSYHADPRVVTGFRPEIKELIYPLVMKRSKGAHLWDLDGNQYIDLTCGFGSNFFGNMPDWLEKRLLQQISEGMEIGPQHHLAGQVAKKVCAYLQHDRVAFCNTGSEAILGALRIARTVTGRSKVISFTGSYHGIIDEVIVRSSKSGKSFPAAPGILPNTVENIEALDYGTDAALARIRAQAHDIAAILVEGVQSRRPDFRPKEFIQELRKICDETGAVLIMDEIITGFRTGRLGAQGYYGIKADLATYGKVIGGGASIGVIAGRRQYMDALDGGAWSFGDQSAPEVGVTYFAGTFVRHPLALAAMDAVMDFLASQPDDLAQKVMERADRYVARMNAMFKEIGAPYQYVNFGSMMKLNPTEELRHLDILVYLLRDRGIHTWDGFPNFLTIAHSDSDIQVIEKAFRESLVDMREAGFFTGKEAPAPTLEAAASGKKTAAAKVFQANQPPVAGARLGRDEKGMPAWFIPHPSQPGKYLPLA